MSMANQGLTKLIEECGELVQILAKKTAYPTGKYPTRKFKDINARIVEEMGDVLAAMEFVVDKFELPGDEIEERMNTKLKKYKEWDSA